MCILWFELRSCVVRTSLINNNTFKIYLKNDKMKWNKIKKMEIQVEKLRAKNIITLYKWRNTGKISHYQTEEPLHKLDIPDIAVFQEKLIWLASQSASQYQEITPKSQGWFTLTKESDYFKTYFFPLVSKLVDDSNEISLLMQKWYWIDWKKWIIYESLLLELYELNLNEIKKNELMQIPNNKQITCLRFDFETENNYNLGHRITKFAYRQQGFATFILKAAEAFYQEIAQKNQRSLDLTVSPWQIEVMLWLLKNDYNFQSREDKSRFEEIVSGANHLCLGEDNYVFTQDIPEQERNKDNRENSYLIKMVKNIPFKSDSTEIKQTIDWVHNHYSHILS